MSYPLCLGGFVSYFSYGSDTTLNDAYLYATGIVFAFGFFVITYAPFTLYLYKLNGNLRVACGGLVYRKAVRILKSSTKQGQTGKIANLLSNDVKKFDEVFIGVYDIWRGPLEAFSFLVVIYMEIGVSAFIGMGFMACFIPLQRITFHILMI